MPTREHYPGEHQIVFIVNSVEEAEAKLTLIKLIKSANLNAVMFPSPRSDMG